MKGIQNYDKFNEYEKKLERKFKDIFQEFYFKRGMGITQISKEIDVPCSSLEKYFKRLGFMPLFKSELQKLKEKDLTDKKCVICNKQIPYYRKEKETCNHLCAKELGRLNKKKEKIASREGKHFYCRWCKKEIIDHSKPTDYCSQSCRTSAQHETQGQVRITLTCKTCGKEFKVLKDRNTNYCSHKCMYDDITDSTTIEDIIQVATFFYKQQIYLR
jgi:hypothetical protein